MDQQELVLVVLVAAQVSPMDLWLLHMMGEGAAVQAGGVYELNLKFRIKLKLFKIVKLHIYIYKACLLSNEYCQLQRFFPPEN